MERNDKQAYSVDRVESRRQRRVFKVSKGNLPLNFQKVKNQSKRSMSEGRHDKKLLARSRSQRQIPSFHLKNNAFGSYLQSPSTKEINGSKDPVFHLKNSSLKSVKSNLNYMDNQSV